ncbi:MAG: CBS domain-containing protein [Actinobacteria bacterium]|nr:CBS domain-containing protein [Actinomycetota bacterium]
MKAREIMTRPVVTVYPDTLVKEAAARLAQHDVGSMPVVDDDDRLIGIVSESDLLRDRLPHDPRAQPRRDTPDGTPTEPPHTVAQVMTRNVLAMAENADTADIAEAMLLRNVRAVPIVDGAALVGIVSRQDLLRTLIRDDDVIATEVRERLDAYTGSHGRWNVAVNDGAVVITGYFEDDAERRVITVLARTVPGVGIVHTTNRHLVT